MLRLSKYKLKLIREVVNIQLLRNLYSEKEVETARKIIRDITNELQEVNVYWWFYKTKRGGINPL